ncbi:hypothetical protein A2230_09300 [candidate division WOR-1 bacterium RIFOXYA2_FULL_36_21]|uniref:BPL/LPL catalytic domain-containing protein n=1 Tax=candidate division WOR-1 bacterium RIFOXYB2_FULL_36_35 TaxID=1802578 RepID=A0A1F4S3P2_UNCSA|nr:MAG: hypothetical protein A2230_09300 [candidate division WOR-1 bacterium RIFOXYA2_FULL_36_21]OGC15051.1 MAG: hypothetical protein A2290_09120 [candidate division WOR-1 bacterium RIFOXYB2_FULL_36_35]
MNGLAFCYVLFYSVNFSMKKFSLFIDKNKSGSFHMQRDLSLFQKCEAKDDLYVICIYSFYPPCISLGYSQKEEKEIDMQKAKSLGWEVVKRPTGGGIVFHNTAEITYSLIMPAENPILPKGLISSYLFISEAVVIALKSIGIKADIKQQTPDHRQQITNRRQPGLCFSYPAEHEIVVEGKKVVGSAQKRGKNAILQQGSIFVRKSDERIFSVLKRPFKRYNAISVEEVLGREVVFDEIKYALTQGFKERLGISLK